MASYSDNFNRATLGDDWTAVDGTWDIDTSTDRVRVNNTGEAGAFPSMLRYETELDTENHFCEIRKTNTDETFAFISPGINVSASGKTGYYARVQENHNLAGRTLRSMVDGLNTTLLTVNTPRFAPPVTQRLARSGNLLTLSVGSEDDLEYEIVGQTLSGKRVGLFGHYAASARADDFSAEDLPGQILTTATTSITANSAMLGWTAT